MAYFSSREIAAIALSSALWAVINWTVAPVFWNLTHLPILCDMAGISLLTLIVWWVRKPGAATLMGVIATILNFMLRPEATQFLGFTAASLVFDVLVSAVDYWNILNRRLVSTVSLFTISVLSTLVAGFIIGTFFMNPMFLSNMFGGVTFFAALHGAGGLIGGILGLIFVRGLEARRVIQLHS